MNKIILLYKKNLSWTVFLYNFSFLYPLTRSTKHRQSSEERRGGVCQRSNYRNHPSRRCFDSYNHNHGCLLQASRRASEV